MLRAARATRGYGRQQRRFSVGEVPLASKYKEIVLRPEDPCPCRSGKRLGECCLQPDGFLRKRPPTLIPPPPRTGHAQAGCYLSTTMDCSPDLSAEHYMSRSVLEALGNVVAVDGVPWLPRGETKIIAIDSLTAKILCTRHNSALSPLDTEAGAFFKELQAIQRDLPRRSLSRKRSSILLSGETLELWMLKVACGLFYSKIAAANRARLIDDHTFDEELVRRALLRGEWANGCGLYMKSQQGLRIAGANAIAMSPLTALIGKRVVGAGVTVTGLEFEVVFDPVGVNSEQLAREGWGYRPTELYFAIQTRAHSIMLTWPPGTRPRSIRMMNAIVPRPREPERKSPAGEGGAQGS